GVNFYSRISSEAPKILNACGFLIYEIGIGQSEAVHDIMVKSGFKNIEIIKDLSGTDRVILGQISTRTQ
ncbi:MAG: hypothetical protein II085_02340, partial [Alphaproteobacteria bacterium]|nr:hypothetical protein [Alphaproteobacteria bacterium]